ncbi:MAG: hydrogenase formation protein HypD [Candidatus Moranbacteria bacterium]|nr:hydrogenase formation protein HypD [Candidatus Moranbacteria bacterium]
MKPGNKKILRSIHDKAGKIGRPLRLMELCGTHSQTIAQNGIKSLMPKNVKLVSGPGCPVCVTDQSDIDVMAGLALSGVPVAAYGDTLNVPGNLMSLEGARRKGADVSVVYDIAEAVAMAKGKPGLVFFGLGFETTTGMTAWAIKAGLIVYCAHKLFPPAMRALLADKKIKVDGFIDPGHVSAIIGTEAYRQFKIPQVVAGFSGEDVLRAIEMLLTQILEGRKEVENDYPRLVRKEGNLKARKLIAEVFETSDARWRGLGEIKGSGLKIRKKYQKQDAKFMYRDLIGKIKKEIKPKPSACKCGLVLQGLIEPQGCPLFGRVCTPDKPQGACMVSVEGSCNVEYRYGK